MGISFTQNKLIHNLNDSVYSNTICITGLTAL